MGTSDRGGAYSAMAMAIPIDLFVSKKQCSDLGLPRGELGFCDSSGEPLLSMERDPKSKRSWKVFKEIHSVEKELICTVEGRRRSLTRFEFNVFLSGETEDEDEINCSSTSTSLTPIYKMKGFPFQKSCTIYKGDSIVAQTSLMYKLHQIYAKKTTFRVTLYPNCKDASFIVALVGIFLQ